MGSPTDHPRGKRRPITDHLDIKRLHARDPELLTALVRDLGPRIWVAIRPYARDDDHADDLLQDCWIRILEQLDTYRRDESFAAWALEVSRNLCKMRARARKRAGFVEVPVGRIEGAEQEDDPGFAEESRQAANRWPEPWKRTVYEALGRLPEREREMIVLRLLEGRKASEAAKILGVSVRAARLILARGMARLRQMEELRKILRGSNTSK